MYEVKPCPFCGAKLKHVLGKRVNRYYNGEPTMYEHPLRQDCLLGRYGQTIQVYGVQLEAWNKRVGDKND